MRAHQRGLARLLAPVHRRHALAELRRMERRLPSQRGRLAIPFVLKGHGLFRTLRPRQSPEEIEGLYDRVCALRPRRVLEIGTAKGGTLYLWAQAAHDEAVLVSVDLPGGRFGGGYPEAKAPFFEAFARPGQSIRLLRADSHAPECREAVERALGGEPVDFAFIDGDHTYEGVKRDWNDYAPLVRPGGLVAFHDILPQPASPQTQVHRLWEELRELYPSRELVGRGSGPYGSIGIGLVAIPEGGAKPLDATP